MRSVTGVVQHYAWGDQTFIPALLGQPADGRPWAELWLGTHPAGPAVLADGRPLASVSGPLPYLLKVLAAAEPLSLQTHPTDAQAALGHTSGIFADSNSKPELLCALTPFEALCGIRPVAATESLLAALGAGTEDLATVLVERGPGAALATLYRGDLAAQPLVDACTTSGRPEAGWVRRLAARYPSDPSVAASLLLNYVVLRPGEGLRLDAGNLHAYLQGSGIELMRASDNVVRGGLTTKPVDVDLLLDTVDPTPLADPVLPNTGRYELPAVGVALVRFAPGDTHRARGHELAIDRSGQASYLAPGDRLVASVETFVVTPL